MKKHPGGRPVSVNASVPVAWRLDPETVAKIERLSAQWRCSKAEVVRRIVKER